MAVCPSLEQRKMEVGPSAPPMMEIAAAALPRAQQEALGVGDQGTEVRHGADAHENQRGKNRPLIQDIEVIQKTAGLAFAERRHDIGIDIDQQHTECDRNKEQGLEFMGNSQIQEKAGYYDHQDVAPCQVHERGLVY